MSSDAEIGAGGLEERIETLSTWVGEIADRVRATELATGDEKTAKELRRALEAVAKHDPRLESRLTNRIDVLGDRLDTLASAVSTTTSELARRDGEIAALRRELDRGNGQIQVLAQELAKEAPTAEIETLRRAVASLSTEHSPRKADEQVVRLGGKVDYLTERVDTLAKTVAATAAGLAGREGDLATLRHTLDERARHLEQELHQVALRPAETELDRRLGELEVGLEELIARNARVERDRENDLVRVTALEGTREATSDAVVEGVREALAALLGDVERDRAATATRFEEFAGERTELRTEIGRVSTLVAAQLEELVARIEQVERLQAAGATETARVSNEWRSKFEAVTSLEAQLQSIAEGVARAARRTESERPALDELDERLRAVEQAGIDAAAELARVSSAWADELDRMAAKIDDSVVAASRSASRESEAEQLLAELGTRLDAIVHERQTVAAQIAKASENEVAELRNLIDGLRSPFAPVDQESAGSPSVEGRIDELARRPESMQIIDGDLESEPRPGEGRQRLELRALELRAERAEKAAQQSREAVLAQVDLLTDQVESRFQKLESETTEPSSAEVDGHEEEVGHAKVVPLRGGEV